ncbi:MAG: arginine deiminase [Bacteroidetes bacterium]|nr:arginine deiminase [Bacteroidota bacterium]MBL6944682.1 arginine deiminase [Bacteroidales bacterium]
MQPINININSEIGKLEGVIVHLPGPEVENMTPENAQRALYSDILNLSVALPEYNNFIEVLKKFTKVFEVSELLLDIINYSHVKHKLLKQICAHEHNDEEDVCKFIEKIDNESLAAQLVQGIEIHKNNLTRFLDNERYCLNPLPNFFFTRDASFAVGGEVLISKMARKVRDREAIIMEAIFKHHPLFKASTINPVLSFDKSGKGTIEGGDVIIARDDILLIGTGERTSTQGIDSVIEHIKTKPGTHHLIVQELPYKPESFIHLDMVFTFLDKDSCMIFEPLIIHATKYLTIHITIDNHKVTNIKEENNILTALKSLGMELEPIFCGGNNDVTIMEREQWQSGANFFCLEPGKIIGYGRNTHTIEALNKHGFEVVVAKDIVKGKSNIEDYNKLVVTIEGNELSRGGGGARCMTMPLSRQNVSW